MDSFVTNNVFIRIRDTIRIDYYKYHKAYVPINQSFLNMDSNTMTVPDYNRPSHRKIFT